MPQIAKLGWGEWREEDLKDASQVIIAKIKPCLLLLLSRVCCRIQGWIFVPKVPPLKFSNCKPVSKFWTLLSNLSLKLNTNQYTPRSKWIDEADQARTSKCYLLHMKYSTLTSSTPKVYWQEISAYSPEHAQNSIPWDIPIWILNHWFVSDIRSQPLPRQHPSPAQVVKLPHYDLWKDHLKACLKSKMHNQRNLP